MPYSLEFGERVNRDLARLDAPVSRRILNRIDDLADQSETISHEALAGPLRGQFRLRVGGYRIIYELDRVRRSIIILRVQHRSEAYRR